MFLPVSLHLPTPFSVTSLIFNKVGSLVGTGSYARVSTITRQDRVHFPFQLFSLGQMTGLSPMLHLAPRQSHVLIWRFLPVSLPYPHLEGRFLLWPASTQELTESLSSVTCHSAAQTSPSLAPGAVERVRLNLKLILHSLCPWIRCQKWINHPWSFCQRNFTHIPPKQDDSDRAPFGLLSNWPLRFPSCICRQASTANWPGEGKQFTASRACSGQNVTCNAVC